jgi:ubiquinone/menaquinone biosynthesis C-methylase UbiE
MQQAPGPGLLAVFAELVQSGRGGPVADIGCGTGRVTVHSSPRGEEREAALLSSGADELGADRAMPG